MLDKDLKKMSRQELLELLLDQTKRNEKLQSKITELEEKLSDKIMTVSEKGSLAEASIAICNVLDTVQQAADIYSLNSQKMAEEKAVEIIENAKAEAAEIKSEAFNYALSLKSEFESKSVDCPGFDEIVEKYSLVESQEEVKEEVLDV